MPRRLSTTSPCFWLNQCDNDYTDFEKITPIIC